ncbi:glucosaminidase domain-containing protein, partial [Candidatus Woesebacteria bacterium]|nr:glucosaminidase domain-containing protein [Candidatus Woesebacteria bacterium]
LTVLVIIFILSASQVSAEVPIADGSAQLRKSQPKTDYRVGILKAYLSKHNSPLAPYAGYLVAIADKYNIDWRLVVAISGVESTFGKRIPYNSYNAYGWANGAYNFKSWEDSIELVTKTLREKYIDRGAPSIAKIARRYAPPSSTWAGKVKFFMKKIEPLPLTFTLEG